MSNKVDNLASNMATQFAFEAAGVHPDHIDRDTGRIMNLSLISVGPAIGHGLYVDDKSLETILDQIEEDKLPSYVTHRGAIFDDRLTREIGYMHNFRIQGSSIKADFQAFESFRKDEDRRYNRLFELAEEMPNRFGVSIVFAGNVAWATSEGDVPFKADEDRPENAIYKDPSIRVEAVDSADFVDSPAANPRGLFRKIDNQPLSKPISNTMTKAELESLCADLKEENETLSAKVAETETNYTETVEKLSEANARVEAIQSEKDEAESSLSDATAKVDELSAKVSESDEQVGTLSEQIETKTAELAQIKEELIASQERATSLQSLMDGEQPQGGSSSDGEEYQPSASARSKAISEYARENKISEFAATVELSRKRPELWKTNS